MLKSIFVKNFAIIDNIQIDFSENMTVLTGETGAGKSLIIDAIGLLFGDRASSELIRFGETKAIIEGVFTDTNIKVSEILQELEIEEEDFLTIRREIYNNGKNLCKINGNSVSLNVLQELSNYLGNIHTQFDSEKLVNPKNYFNFIDNEEIKLLLALYQDKLKEYNKVKKEYDTLLANEAENNQKLEFYKYQFNDLKNVNLNVDEENDLKERSNVLNNYEKISSQINEFINIYDNNDILDKIYESIQLLEKIEKYNNKFSKYKTILEENYYNVNDILEEIHLDFKNQDIDYNELDEINERLGIYSDYKRKYKMSTEEIVNFYHKLEEEIQKVENFDILSEKLKESVDKLYNDLLSVAQKISDLRKKVAHELVEKIRSNLLDLQLSKTILDIVIKSDSSQFKKNGIDDIDILITFNEGEPLKPLSKIASGGELSRFMLALKAITANQFVNQTLIFDEIDNGVSGSVAYSIANKIKEISQKSQVLCVTHLVQVAAISDHQLHISKEIDNNRTKTNIKELNYEERVEEISKMASFGLSSEASRNFAKELLKNSIITK